MRKTDVCIIDSHVLVRQIISSIIRDEKDISISGCTSGKNEKEVINSIYTHSPDVVFIGIDEPDSRSEKLFLKLRKTYPLLPVIVVTPLNKQGAEIAINALKDGAVEFITKPEKGNCLILSKNHFKKRIIPMLHKVTDFKMEATWGPFLPDQSKKEEISGYSDSPFYNFSRKTELVVIGGCTGGVRSLYKIISSLPSSFPVPVIVAQHMPQIYTGVLSEDLDRHSSLKVIEAKNNSVLLPGYVYIAPGGYHTIVKSNAQRRTLSLYRGPKVHHSRPSLDVLFWSAAQAFREKTLGVLLSGGGKDGVEGARQIRSYGGDLITESKRSSLVWDLPEKVNRKISRGSYDSENLATEINRRVFTIKPVTSLMKEVDSSDHMVENAQVQA
ncbi:MAG: chemotaxis protein CheB [Balneolaceae bacterium]